MAVDDHGLETLKKAAEEVVPGSKADYYYKTGILIDGEPISDLNPLPVSGATGSSGGSTTPTIYNVPAAIADTEYSQALSDNTKKFMIRVRGIAKMQLAFISGDTNITFITVPGGNSYFEDNLNITSKTLYFRTNQPNQTIEVMEWS